MRLADAPAVIALIEGFYTPLIEGGIVRETEIAPDLAEALAA
jgi:hypothetical protein